MLDMMSRPRPLLILVCCLALMIDLHGADDSAVTRADSGPLPVHLFYSPGCRGCAQVIAAMRRAEERFGEAIAVDWRDTSRDPTAIRSLSSMLRRYRYEGLTPPSLNVFTPRRHLAGPEQIIADLESTIAAELAERSAADDGPRPDDAALPPDDGAEDERNLLGWTAITVAALVDSVNPCAFATIVMLISMLGMAGRRRRDILLAGAGFTLGVFLAYLAIGLVLFSILQQLQSFYVIADLIMWLAFLLCLAGATLCLWDASLSWRGRPAEESLMKVPTALRRRINAWLRAGVHTRIIILGSFGAGLVVSLLESLCTGQIYFPIIARLVRQGDLTAIIMLLWYNVLFVLPIIVIVILTWAGMGNQQLIAFGRRSWGRVKLLLVAAFLLMAWWMSQDGNLVWPPGWRGDPPPQSTIPRPAGD